MAWCSNCDTFPLNRASEGKAAGWHAAQGWVRKGGARGEAGWCCGGRGSPSPHLTSLQMPHDDRGPHYQPQQDTWHWRELSVFPEVGACQATAAWIRVYMHNNPLRPPSKKHPHHPPKPLHNPPSTLGHAGKRPPQYNHCCAPGRLSPPYQRDETFSHTHTQQWSWVWWCVNMRLRMMDCTLIAQQLFAV